MTCKIGDTFPIQIKDVDPESNDELMKYWKVQESGFVRVGPHGYLLPHRYKQVASKLFNLPLRASDVFVGGFPRSGTNWTQELVWLIVNDLDYKTAGSSSLFLRYSLLCFFYTRLHPEVQRELTEMNKHSPTNLEILERFYNSELEILDEMPSSMPRFLKFHEPVSLFPPKLLETAKMVYIARDPRDVMVSCYYLFRLYCPIQFCGDFKQYWKLFIGDQVLRAPYFEHVKEAWEMRNHPNMLFLFYEDMVKDLPSTVRRVAQFFGKRYTDDQIQQLCQHLSFDSCKHNQQLNGTLIRELSIMLPDERGILVRKGVTGGWREHFDAKMRAQTDQWIARNLRGSDLRFPTIDIDQL